MKLVVKQSNLAKALGNVSRIAAAKAGFAILANVLLKTQENKLVIAATNLEVAIVESINAQVDEGGAITVPARLITDFVANLPHTNVNIELDDNKIKLSADGYKSTINALDAKDYPALPDTVAKDEFSVDAAALKTAISTVATVCGNDVTRPILTGAYLYTDNGSLKMAATDGYRLAERTISDGIDEELGVIIPASTLSDVSRIASDAEGLSIKYDDEQITFTANDTSLTSRLIDGKFIDYAQLIPKETTYQIKVNRGDFIRIVKIAELFARQTAGSIIIESSEKDQTLQVRSITSQLGDNSSSIEAEVKGGDGTVTLNSKFLLTALNCIEGDMVNMDFNGKLAPILLTGESQDYKHIIMPVRS